ncbi:MAG: efflux RND transporter periplasmic adaptor subunit [Nitrospira sp. SB0666_bin_27]|nr:efflux RND transporter periplasmic adaptor subunit [Nitrospira sp. SB0666_bin_27]MYF24998.1 efflux RND transporter periplasmic adaptor subunit [Nitrospira sp. SB0678_bin_10]
MNKPFHSEKRSATKLVLTSFLLPLIGLTACQQEGGPPPAPPPPEVKVMTIVAKTIPDEVEFIGQTASFRPVEIRSQVTGIIQKVLFTEGRDVRKGERLYLIDPVPFQASVASAKGRVGQALARLAQARAELARVRPLLAEQAVSQKDVDDAVAENLAAKAALVTAKGDWEKAKFDLRNTLIVAPVAGRPERSRLYEGRLVSAQSDLLTSIHQMDPIYVNVNVPESYILRRQRELAARRVERPDLFQLKGMMIMADGTTYPHEGTLDFAGIQFRSETGSLSARFKFPNARQRMFPGDRDSRPLYSLFPGQFVKIRVRGYMRRDAILVPQRAVQQGPKGLFVYVVNGDKVELRAVAASSWHGQEWLLEDGVHAGDRVVVEGFHRIRPGSQVIPVPYQPPASSSDAPGSEATPREQS